MPICACSSICWRCSSASRAICAAICARAAASPETADATGASGPADVATTYSCELIDPEHLAAAASAAARSAARSRLPFRFSFFAGVAGACSAEGRGAEKLAAAPETLRLRMPTAAAEAAEAAERATPPPLAAAFAPPRSFVWGSV